MIGRSEEYAKMFELESQLWWYRHLHERTEAALQQQFGQRRDMQILDAGCGTGGMLDFLGQKGLRKSCGVLTAQRTLSRFAGNGAFRLQPLI